MGVAVTGVNQQSEPLEKLPELPVARLQPLLHEGKEMIQVSFSYNEQIYSRLKDGGACQWLGGPKCFALPPASESLHRLLDELQGVAVVWLYKDYQLQAPFVKLNQTYFDATVLGLDFTSPAAKDQMNNWVKEKTNGKITGIIEATSADDVLFLINAIYFKGTWTYLFDKELTKPAPFYLEDGSTVSHDFMTATKTKYLYYQDNSKKLIDLPYGNGQFSMTLLVPEGQHTVNDVVQELNDENLSAWLAAADTSGVELHMPKFKMEYKKELNETLAALGMGIAFSSDADFSNMVNGSRSLNISEVMHKTFLEVNEEGTEAAAVTSVGIGVTSAGPSVLNIDRPFVFLIREKSSNTILFIGKLMQP